MAQTCAHGGVLRLLAGNPCRKSVLNVQRLSVENGVRSERWRQKERRGRVVVRIEDLQDSILGGRRERWGVRRGRVVCAVSRMEDSSLPTQEDIIAAAREKGLVVAIKVTGPLFVVTAIDVATGENLGTADGFVKPWIDTNILHLDSIRLTKASATRGGRTIFGAAMYMGALMVRHGIDCACDRGELLAINDSDEYHRKLVRYYTRLGWKAVYEVKGESWRDYLHMLVWGGVGTRMDCDLRELLGKWAASLTPKAALVESSS